MRAAVWVLAARPATLWAAVAPVAVGTACAVAAGGFRAGPAAGALLCALLLQVGTNYANDLFDFYKGADTEERLGPTRAVQAGLVTPRQMAWATAVAFGLAALCGLYLAAVAGWPVLAIGAAAILAGLAYTAGPLPLAYHGLGDPFVFVFFGLVAVVGTVWVQLGAIPQVAWWVAVAVGCLSTAILVVNNIRDIDSDRRAGKRTLAVRLGRDGSRLELLLLFAVAYFVPVGLMLNDLARPAILLPMTMAPLAGAVLRQIRTEEGAALNDTLAATARHLLLFSLLLSLGLLAGTA